MKSESEIAQSCPTCSDPMDCSLPGSSAHGVFQARVLEWVAIDLSSVKHRLYLFVMYLVSHDSLLSESPGKPKNTRVSSLSLPQEIFPTKESNWGLLHHR